MLRHPGATDVPEERDSVKLPLHSHKVDSEFAGPLNLLQESHLPGRTLASPRNLLSPLRIDEVETVVCDGVNAHEKAGVRLRILSGDAKAFAAGNEIEVLKDLLSRHPYHPI